MHAIERIKEMSDSELVEIFNCAVNQNPQDHAPLYGVDFEVWIDLLYSAKSQRGLK